MVVMIIYAVLFANPAISRAIVLIVDRTSVLPINQMSIAKNVKSVERNIVPKRAILVEELVSFAEMLYFQGKGIIRNVQAVVNVGVFLMNASALIEMIVHGLTVPNAAVTVLFIKRIIARFIVIYAVLTSAKKSLTANIRFPVKMVVNIAGITIIQRILAVRKGMRFVRMFRSHIQNVVVL